MLTRHWALWLINTVWSQLMAAVTCWNLHSLIRHIIKLQHQINSGYNLHNWQKHTHTSLWHIAHVWVLVLYAVFQIMQWKTSHRCHPYPLVPTLKIFMCKDTAKIRLKKRTAICELDCSKSLRLNAYDLFLIIYSSMDCVNACMQ